eukprot:CAMPEP_0170493244 /NCGR_PEP_ID=MMETSP0208-20121228/13596_1 /TAXON_ID=197538 /ORGANISM="Strombidium inclinatum, Strain S3" /LENGTH=86 /DNA_ID=CAMNT_0010769143 /DNA_START=219 /DNA_END=480 /DNA_ORIENTATION=+
MCLTFRDDECKKPEEEDTPPEEVKEVFLDYYKQPVVPETCSNWFDGCNNCRAMEDKKTGKKAWLVPGCFAMREPNPVAEMDTDAQY